MARKISGLEIRGAVGMDFLRHHIIQLDVSAGMASILDGSIADPASLGMAIPIDPTADGPSVAVCLPGQHEAERFLIDTGSTNVAQMTPALLSVLQVDGTGRKVGDTLSAGLSQIKANEKWMVVDLAIGGAKESRILVTKSPVNSLGIGFFTRYCVTFDFPNSMMYIKRRSHDPLPFDLDVSGLHLLRTEGKTIVHSIDSGSAADRAGVLPGDILTGLDGVSITCVSMHRLRHRFCQQGARIDLQITRGQRNLECTITLSRPLAGP
ncbi:MAG: PDZ domain-containing protein [Gemmataceae bacterium]